MSARKRPAASSVRFRTLCRASATYSGAAACPSRIERPSRPIQSKTWRRDALQHQQNCCVCRLVILCMYILSMQMVVIMYCTHEPSALIADHIRAVPTQLVRDIVKCAPHSFLAHNRLAQNETQKLAGKKILRQCVPPYRSHASEPNEQGTYWTKYATVLVHPSGIKLCAYAGPYQGSNQT